MLMPIGLFCHFIGLFCLINRALLTLTHTSALGYDDVVRLLIKATTKAKVRQSINRPLLPYT